MTNRAARVTRELVVLYGRLSENPNDKKNVEMQLSDGRKLAAARGYGIAKEFSDDGISAWKPGVRRPGFEAMMDYLRANSENVHAIVVYQSSRLVRDREERARVFTELARLSISVLPTAGPELDLTNAGGFMLADIMGAFDTAESAIKSERVTRASEERAMNGKANSVCPFGWRRESDYNARGYRVDWRDVEDIRAATIVREIAKRIADGEALHAVTDDMNRRRIPTPGENRKMDPSAEWVGAGKWTTKAVMDISRRPANVARRVYRGADVGPASWPALVDDSTHARVVARFAASAGHIVKRERPTDRRWLFSCTSWATCGLCGSTLVCRSGYKRRRVYACARHCVQRSAAAMDGHVVGLALLWLAKPGNRAALLDGHVTEDVSALMAERAELAETQTEMGALVGRGITTAQLMAWNRENQPRLDAIDERIRRAASQRGSADIPHVRTVAEWLALGDGPDGLTRQRRLLEALQVRVEIHPTRSKGWSGFNPTDVHVWVMGARMAESPVTPA